MFVDIDEYTSYYVLKIPSNRALSSIQTNSVCAISSSLEQELNLAFAQSSFVILVFSVVGSFSFDGYAIMTGLTEPLRDRYSKFSDYHSSSRLSSIPVHFVRRGLVQFNQVVHIRDDQGLRGRPISSAKDGVRLGTSAARALCRGIDKRSYREDPIHYKDSIYHPRILHESKIPTRTILPKSDTNLLDVSYAEYVNWFNDRSVEEPVPSLVWSRKFNYFTALVSIAFCLPSYAEESRSALLGRVRIL